MLGKSSANSSDSTTTTVNNSPPMAVDMTSTPNLFASPFVGDLSEPVVPDASIPDDPAVRSVIEHILASPEFQSLHDFESFTATTNNTSPAQDFMTSPLIDTPYDDFLSTSPQDDSPFSQFLSTPVVQDIDLGAGVDFGSMNLFGGPMYEVPSTPIIEQEKPLLSAADMWTMSPGTPALESLDPQSIYPSPIVPSELTFSPSPGPVSVTAANAAATKATTPPAKKSGRRSATGTRKNLTPDSLIPVDAPTQPRKYALPSATSRKELPVTFQRKRAHATAFGPDAVENDDDDFETLADLPPNATEKEQIEWKRRQNTLAARKSRKRKLEHQQFLESRVEDLEREVGIWKTRSETLLTILRSHGHLLPEFKDD